VPNPSATGAIQTEIISGRLGILPVDGFQLTRPLHRLRWRDRAQGPATLAFFSLLDQRYPRMQDVEDV